MTDTNESPVVAPEDPISPSSFVEHIRELGEKRDKEDAERYRLLEEQILQGRAERAARRAERHRSLSPDKNSAYGSPKSIDTPRSVDEKPLGSPITMDRPLSQAGAYEDTLKQLTGASSVEAQGDESPVKPSSPASHTPTRSGTLSWQQRRPTSATGRRPLSVYAAENSAARSPRLGATPDPTPSTDEQDTPTRSQIEQSLGSKDPSWFKQTADRGISSPAYRQSQEDAASEIGSTPSRRQLQGMTRDSTTESVASPPTESVRSDSPSRASSVRTSAIWSNRFSKDTTVSGFSTTDAKTSPLPMLESQKFRPPVSDLGSSADDNDSTGFPRGLAMSPAQERIAPDRSPSPTKGVGGFVQSAMMRRSDSVNKRWSAQGSPGLSRHSSTAGHGGGAGGSISSVSTPKLEARPSSRGESHSRPSSSHSNHTVTQSTGDKTESGGNEVFTRPTLSMRHSRGKSMSSFALPSGISTSGTNSPDPSSPTKRWSRSPTKSSWLESALNARPEAPRPKPPPPQPSWMAEISKAKAQRQSVDLSKTPDLPKPESPATTPVLSPVGRLRGKSVSRGSPAAQSPDLDQSPAEEITEPKEPQAAPELEDTSSAATSPPPNSKSTTLSSPMTATMDVKSEKPAVALKSPALRQPGGPKSPTTEADPKRDFRSQLKSRQGPTPVDPGRKDSSAEDFRATLKSRSARTPTTSEFPKKDNTSDQKQEFQNVFGKLKKTQPEKYVAPDTLKDNILRGKGGLTKTDGPQRNERRDELRDSLVKQRQSIQQKAQETGIHSRTGSLASPAEATPEALARRKNLGRTESVSKPSPAGPTDDSSAPEALARFKSLRDRKQSVTEAKAEVSEEKPVLTEKSPVVEEKPSSPVKSPMSEENEKGVDAPPMVQERVPGLSNKLANRFSPAAKPFESKFESKPKEQDAPAIEPKKPFGPSGNLADRFPTLKSTETKHQPKSSLSEKEQDSPVGTLGNRASGKLADRFNPALAGLLARGPSPMANGAPGSGASGGSSSTAGGSSSTEEPQGPTKELAHMTKGRARGPKRRAPKGKTDSGVATGVEIPVKTEPTPVRKASVPVATVPLVKPKDVLPSSRPTSHAEPAATPEPTTGSPKLEQKPKPAVAAKSAEVSRRVSQKFESTPPPPSPPIKSPELIRRVSAKLDSPVTPSEPPVPTKSPELSRRVSARLESTSAAEPAPPAESTPRQPTPSTKSPEIAKRFSAGVKKDVEQPAAAQPSTPKPVFAERMRQFQENQQRSSPKAPIESPKTLRPLPNPPATTEAKELPPKPKAEVASVKNVAAMWGKQQESTSSPVTRAKSPIKLPTRKDEQAAMEDAGLVRSESPKGPVGLGIGLENASNRLQSTIEQASEPAPSSKPRPTSKPLPSPPLSANLPPKPPRKSESLTASPQIKQESPIPHTSEAARLFGDFFDEIPVATSKLDIDTNAILTARPLSDEKIKTLRKQVEEISGDGKLSPVPSQEEHILFDNSMYLCTHHFATSNGAKTIEVYLWCGSAVPEPTYEDAQLFARKAARDAGGKLITIRQGKETPNFFQAIGGILITRKGTRQEHSNEYMLCGRQHLAHMAFDEIDLSLKNLCSGFPYLLSSRTGLLSGKIFLWKGTGCNAEELGCARLIGMDLGLTPEIEEVDEGKEPQSFLDIFPAPENGGPKRIPRSADHWRLKAKYDNYGVRLFRIEERPVATMSSSFLQTNNGSAVPTSPDREKPKMKAEVAEIAPFSQMDLEAEAIYVLDAFFEIYIVVGALSRSQSHAFSTALLFAQEYGILAASLEDRPFVPVSTVVLEGVPRDMKAVFRCWHDDQMPTAALMAGRPKRGKSLRIVGLQAAIAATRS